MSIMKVSYNTFILLIFSLILFSCSKDDPFKASSIKSDLRSNTPGKKIEIELNSERLLFNSTDDLNLFLHDFNNQNNYAENKLIDLNNKGFYPINSERNTSEKDLNRYLSKGSYVSYENYIPDENFASLLNQSGEIEINDTIYKYTNIGLFFAHKKHEEELYKYLNKHKKLGNNFDSNDPFNYSTEYSFPRTGVVKLNDFVSRFSVNNVKEIESIENESFEENSSNYSNIDDLDEFLQNAQECGRVRGGIRGLFGTVKICNSYFDRKRRVNTRFFNQNFFIYRSIGISTRYQTKRAWIFWTNRTDELALAIEQIYFEFDLPVPDYDKISKELYAFGNRVYNGTGNYIHTFSGNNIPSLPFDTGLKIIIDLNQFGLGSTQINDSRLNDLFWNELWSKAKRIARTNLENLPDNATIIGVTNNKVIIDHRDFSTRKSNAHKLQKIFDMNFNISIKLGVDEGSGIRISSISFPKLYDYENVSAKFVGAGRRGNTIRGGKVIYND